MFASKDAGTWTVTDTGITLIGAAHHDRALLAFGARWQREVPLPLGKTTSQLPAISHDPVLAEDRVSIAVVGAHMNGLPLNASSLSWAGGSRARARPHRSIASMPCPAARRGGPAWCAWPGMAAP